MNIPRANERRLGFGAGDRGRRIRVTVTASNLAGEARRSSMLTRRIA